MNQHEITEIEAHQISFNPNQPRKQFEREALEELASSIKAVGLIHPPVVRPLPGTPGQYELISGERRLKALMLTGCTKIPVIIKESTSCLSAQAALIENIQRVDLNPLEIAEALKKLISEFGFTQELLSQRVAKSRPSIANHLRLLNLPQEIQESLSKNEITMGHAKALLSLDTPQEQSDLHKLILQNHLSVRQVEELVKKKPPKIVEKKNPNPHLNDLKKKLEEHLGTSVSLSLNGHKGRLTIDYYSLNDLQRLLDLIGISTDET